MEQGALRKLVRPPAGMRVDGVGVVTISEEALPQRLHGNLLPEDEEERHFGLPLGQRHRRSVLRRVQKLGILHGHMKVLDDVQRPRATPRPDIIPARQKRIRTIDGSIVGAVAEIVAVARVPVRGERSSDGEIRGDEAGVRVQQELEEEEGAGQHGHHAEPPSLALDHEQPHRGCMSRYLIRHG
jgi:hypothetical protein